MTKFALSKADELKPALDTNIQNDQGPGWVVLGNFTTTERDALTNVQDGTMLYNTTTNKANLYANGAWEEITSA